MKHILSFIFATLLPMVASADETQDMTVSDVQNSGCVRNSRANVRAKVSGTEITPSVILTKEGSILSVQVLNYESNCGTDGFNVIPNISGSPLSISIQIGPYGNMDEDCYCPFNISFTLHGLESNSFYFSCAGYKEQVNLTEGEPFELWKEKDINIDGVTYRLDKGKKTATVMDGLKYEGELNIPSEVSYGGQACAVTSINYFAFTTDTKLTSVSIPNSMKSISVMAFNSCENLKDVYCYAENVPYAVADAFEYIHSSATLHVPAGSVDKYKATAPWSNFKNIVPLTLKINETTFPNEGFRNWVLAQSYGEDGVLADEEIADVKKITVMAGEDILSLRGIEYFTALTHLNCNSNKLTALDLSKNTALKELYCGSNPITTLDLSMNTKLTNLACGQCQLTSLDVSNNTALITLSCNSNKLTALDVSKNTKLTNLFCNSNSLTTLDVSQNTALGNLNCSDNHLTALTLSGCSAMESLQCSGNKLTTLDVSGCSDLEEIFCYSNKIKGEAMDALVASLPTARGFLGVINYKDEQNVMTKSQVAAAKAKRWIPKYKNSNNQWQNYEGNDPIEPPVTFTAAQVATIILPTAPDASKGKYYRLDRCEEGQIIFEQELHPQAHTPYIIVPNEDFSIDPGTLDLAGLGNDTVSVGGVSFIGSYNSKELNEPEGFYIDIIDTTPDCGFSLSEETGKGAFIGALRAYLQVSWDEPYNPGGSKVPGEKMGIVLRDYGTGISSLTPDPIPGREDEMFNSQRSMFNDIIYDLSGRKINSSFFTFHSSLKKGIYIKDGKKMIK